MSFDSPQLVDAAQRFRDTALIIRDPGSGAIGVAFGQTPAGVEHLATLPPLFPEWLGNRGFCETHGVRFPYVGGAMANGIASPAMVIALARSGMLGFLGTAGLSLHQMEEYLRVTSSELDAHGASWGANLIHSPQEPGLEMATVELFLRHGVRRVSASAFMRLTPAAVRFSASGLAAGPDGETRRPHKLFAKISRPEVASAFLSPPPLRILDELVAQGLLTRDEARLARDLPVATDLIVESDSGGHTDNRPLSALFPVIAALRSEIAREHPGAAQVHLGAAGGLGTPEAVAAAFALGADFVLTGSINQASVEAAQSPTAKAMLAQASFSDCTMAPAGDMFEMGVEVQVLRRGTLFAQRARKLFEIYSLYDGIDEIPPEIRERLEREIFQASMEEIWSQTADYFRDADPTQLQRAESDEKHRLALVCRWYLGLSSKWSIQGTEDRRMDYQIWMGPAQGAFNQWVGGTFLEPWEHRQVAQMALNLLEGAAVVTRAHQLRTYGCPMPPAAFQWVPRPIELG